MLTAEGFISGNIRLGVIRMVHLNPSEPLSH